MHIYIDNTEINVFIDAKLHLCVCLGKIAVFGGRLIVPPTDRICISLDFEWHRLPTLCQAESDHWQTVLGNDLLCIGDFQ